MVQPEEKSLIEREYENETLASTDGYEDYLRIYNEKRGGKKDLINFEPERRMLFKGIQKMAPLIEEYSKPKRGGNQKIMKLMRLLDPYQLAAITTRVMINTFTHIEPLQRTAIQLAK